MAGATGSPAAPPGKAPALLEVDSLVKEFGGLRAVDGVSFTLREGSITGLIGPNGAGKTTLFNTLAGAHRPSSGQIRLRGQRIDGLPPHRIFEAGLARTFQIPRPFSTMTLLENLMLVPAGQPGEHFWNNWVARNAVARRERIVRMQAIELLDWLGLERLATEPASVLSGGQRKLLELARVLMARPKAILLDEPGAGVHPVLLAQIAERLRELPQRGVTLLIIEHNLDLVMSLCNPVLVMAQGRLLMEGTPQQVCQDARVLEAYLGVAPESGREPPP